MYTRKEYAKLINSKNENYIKQNIREYTSDNDFILYFGQNVKKNIIEYSDLKNYDNIIDLLPSKKSYKILLYEQSQNSGHWVLLLRYNDIIEYFDAYGNKINHPLTYSKQKNDELDQKQEYLFNLLNNQTKFNVIYNKYKFQYTYNDSGTCGKHVTLRLIKFKYDNMNLNQYQIFFNELKKLYKKSNDEIVTLLIPVGEN